MGIEISFGETSLLSSAFMTWQYLNSPAQVTTEALYDNLFFSVSRARISQVLSRSIVINQQKISCTVHGLEKSFTIKAIFLPISFKRIRQQGFWRSKGWVFFQ